MNYKVKTLILIVVFVLLLTNLPASSLAASQEDTQPDCALLDDPVSRGLMSAMFERRILVACDRMNEFGAVVSDPGIFDLGPLGTDVMVSDPTGDSGVSQTQSETSIALSEDTGTICSGYNDSYSGVVLGQGYTGVSGSHDGGSSFTDLGSLRNSYGDPSMVWRKSDGAFYIASLYNPYGLGLWKSTDDCQSFTFAGKITNGSSDDKELMVVDNNPDSPYYGRMYVAWTDFAAGGRIRLTHSDNAITWSNPIYLSDSGADVQGAWPAVAPNGDLYVGWVRWNPYYTGPIDIEIARSTNGGVSASLVTNPVSGVVNPYNILATSFCYRPALNGRIRYLPSPQLAIAPNGCLSVVYSYDPDTRGIGDVIDVYYRRSCDNGATWEPEIRLNDDGTTTDQWFPTVSAGADGNIASTWYDRRLDQAGNMLFDYYVRTSNDGGLTWDASTRVSDVSSPVYLDPNLATCYHGDYDQQLQTDNTVYVQWSDDRAIHDGHHDPDVWFDKHYFAPDFTLTASPSSQSVCVPDSTIFDVSVGQILGYNSPVTLDVSGLPADTSGGFANNPLTPPDTTELTITAMPAALPGSYLLSIEGVSPDSTHSTGVTINLYTTVPDAATAESPDRRFASRQPTFTWTEADQAETYTLEVAEDADFNSIVYTATVTGTSHTTTEKLSPFTKYWWRVHTDNTCGVGSYSNVLTFRTLIFR